MKIDYYFYEHFAIKNFDKVQLSIKIEKKLEQKSIKNL